MLRQSPIRWLLVGLLIAASLGWSQTGTGNIQGTVKDTSGAVVPKVKVAIVHAATARQYNTETNEVGFFLFPSLQMGKYQISIQATGMEAWKGELNLLAGQSAVIDPVLKVGGTATAVTVAGDVSELVTTNSPTLATVIERQRIEQLPLNGRVISDLVYLTTPGLEAQSNYFGAMAPKLYGLRFGGTFMQDGAALENRDTMIMPLRPPGLDTVAEFRAETNNSSAKMNRPGSIILSTRGGTNAFHGSVFETARNSGLGVARARQDYYNKPPQLVRNEFGANLGGPVILPKYNGRNKTFFFFAYEGYRLRTANTRSVTDPTAAMRQGDFSGLVDNQNRRYTLYDPNTTDANWKRIPFVNNQIPLDRESPLAKYLYSVTPLPNRADNPLVSSNWFGTGFARTNQNTETARIDHRLSDRDQLFFRYTHSPSYAAQTAGYGQAPTTLDGKGNAQINVGQNDTGVASWTHTFSPAFFSETLVTAGRDYRGVLPYTGDEVITTGLGLPNPFNGIGYPRIYYTGFTMNYDSSVNPYKGFSTSFNWDQNFTKVHGRHEFQFGFRYRYERLNSLIDQQEQQGVTNFNTFGTALYDPASGGAYGATPYTGFDAANLFLGVATYSARANRTYMRTRTGERSGYFQDNIKLTSRLTLNFGLRYEFYVPLTERDNAVVGFDEKNKAVVLGRSIQDLVALHDVIPSVAQRFLDQGIKYETADAAGLPSSLVYPDKSDFGPRAGFAYRIGSGNRTTVVRGGYAIFAFPESLRMYNSQTSRSAPTLGLFTANVNDSAQSPDALPNYLLRSVPKMIAGVNSSNAINVNDPNGLTRGSAWANYLDPNQPTARAHEWNLTVERELLPNTSLKLGYIGTHGSRLAQIYSFNDQAPDYVWYATTGLPAPTGEYAPVARRPYDQQVFGQMMRYQKSGWSNNNSFQVEIERRYSKGYAFQFFYVMSNALRAGGNGNSDERLPAAADFLPGGVPTDLGALNRLLFYARDTDVPKHRVNWNWIVDLPFGKGKPLGHNAGRFLNALIGGWQIAGNGNLTSRYFQLPTGNWGPVGNLQVYGTKYPIQDCRSGVCYSGYLYWNGYIPSNRINSYGANGKPNGVMGVPDNYQPMQAPLIARPKDGGSSADPLYAFYDTNTIWVPLKNGTVQRTSYNNNLPALQNQYVLGPMLWSMNASAFKSVQVTERAQLRFNVDFFNVFNMPGMTMPGSDGVATTQFSANTPRILQLSLRLTF